MKEKETVDTWLKRMDNNQTPRNYQSNTLFQLLCDRYNVSYYTKKEKLIELVTEELNF